MRNIVYYINIREYYGGRRVWHEGVMHTTDKKKLQSIIKVWKRKVGGGTKYNAISFEIRKVENVSNGEDENQIRKFLESVWPDKAETWLDHQVKYELEKLC